jgi:hypothetical protein
MGTNGSNDFLGLTDPLPKREYRRADNASSKAPPSHVHRGNRMPTFAREQDWQAICRCHGDPHADLLRNDCIRLWRNRSLTAFCGGHADAMNLSRTSQTCGLPEFPQPETVIDTDFRK